jgi:hypothetical protein
MEDAPLQGSAYIEIYKADQLLKSFKRPRRGTKPKVMVSKTQKELNRLGAIAAKEIEAKGLGYLGYLHYPGGVNSEAYKRAYPKKISTRASDASLYYQPLEAARRGDIVAPPVSWKLRWARSGAKNGKVYTYRIPAAR